MWELACGGELRCQSIVVLNSTEDGEGDQTPASRGRFLQLSVGLGNGMCCLGGPSPVVEGDKLTGGASNMIFAQEDEVIQGVLAKCPVQTVNMGIRIGCVIRSWQSLDVQYLIEP